TKLGGMWEIQVGDVVQIKAGERHWHGAKADTTMAHITITTVGSKAIWGSPVALALAPQRNALLLRPPWRLDVYAVDLDRRVMEHRCAFGRRVGRGEPFERVVHHIIGKGDFVRRKVAFEHAPLRTKVLNTVLHPRCHGGG